MQENQVFANKVSLKQVSSPTETRLKIEISLVASLDMIPSNKRITKMLIRLCGCAGCSVALLFANTEDRFSPIETHLVLYNFE